MKLRRPKVKKVIRIAKFVYSTCLPFYAEEFIDRRIYNPSHFVLLLLLGTFSQVIVLALGLIVRSSYLRNWKYCTPKIHIDLDLITSSTTGSSQENRIYVK